MKNFFLIVLTGLALMLGACQGKHRVTEGASINCDDPANASNPVCTYQASEGVL